MGPGVALLLVAALAFNFSAASVPTDLAGRGGALCSSDLDCQLCGLCTGGACVCDRGCALGSRFCGENGVSDYSSSSTYSSLPRYQSGHWPEASVPYLVAHTS